MGDLAAFLAARLDEDDAEALKLHKRRDGNVPLQRAFAARVLREVEAKRAILAEHPQERVGGHTKHRNDIGCALCHSDDGVQWSPGYCATVRHIAAVYRDHPDYDPAWGEGVGRS